MTRVTCSVARHARKKKLLEAAKGFKGRSKNCPRIARERLEKSWQYQYRDRKVRKRQMRALWIQRINAAARGLGVSYSVLMGAIAKSGMSLDRKVLADMAVRNPAVFSAVVSKCAFAAAN